MDKRPLIHLSWINLKLALSQHNSITRTQVIKSYTSYLKLALPQHNSIKRTQVTRATTILELIEKSNCSSSRRFGEAMYFNLIFLNQFWTIGSFEWATVPVKVHFTLEVALTNPLSMLSIGNETALLELIFNVQIAKQFDCWLTFCP